MNETDDDVVEVDEIDLLFEAVLAGAPPPPNAPTWSGDLTRLVNGARAAGTRGELAAEHDVVSRMVELRVAIAAERRAATAQEGAHHGADHNGVAHDGVGVRVGEAAPLEAEPRPTLRRAASGSPRHARSRAKHAAPRGGSGESSTARDVGRILAFKAAAITTGVVVGTVAAAAATTGIVHNVVVPAIVREAAEVSLPATPIDVPAGAPSADGQADDDDRPAVTVPVPSCQFTPVCSPLTSSSPPPNEAPARTSGASATTTTTERPATTTTTTRPESTTTTTTPEVTTATTEPEPEPTTTTTAPETTTTSEPGPIAPFSLPSAPEPIVPSSAPSSTSDEPAP